MTPEEMAQVRPRLVAFVAEMLGELPRSDQRAKGELYLRGLMLDGKRKSMQPMATRLGVDHQQLQQFVTSSTWDHVGVRKRIARWADEFIDPDAYVIDDTGFPKDGADSPGVARMYSGTLGKVGNCQIGVSVHAVTDWASAAIDWRLFLPKSWDDTSNYSARGRDPDISAGEFGEDIEGPTAVFGRRGEVGAHRGEVLGAGEGAHTPGDLLLDLDHADVAFGRVVVEGHPEVDGEAQIVLQAPADAAGQGPMGAADRPRRPGLGRGADQRRGDDQSPVGGQHVGIGQGSGVGDRLQCQQGVDDLGCPAPPVGQ